MDSLKKQRKTVKGRLTRLQTYQQKSTVTSCTVTDIEVRMVSLEEVWGDYKVISNSIIDIGDAEEVKLQEDDLVENETKFYDTKSGLDHVSGEFTETRPGHSPGQVLLPTAVVNVTDSFGVQMPIRVLLDSGAQASFITEACVKKLGLKRSRTHASIRGLNSSSGGRPRGTVTILLSSPMSKFSIDVDTIILNEVTGQLPNSYFKINHWAHLKNLELADPHFNKPNDVDLLLGSDVFDDIFTGEKVPSLLHGIPSARKTEFGWVVLGKIPQSVSSSIMSHAASVHVQNQLSKFWELEAVPDQQYLTEEEQACESHFITYHSRDSDGRYVLSLPFKDQLSLGLSKSMATKRLLFVEKRRNPEHREEYHNFMAQYLELGHMEPIPPHEREEVPSRTNYLPHHFVLKDSSTTTKLRVVFDGSAKTASGVSLNNKLMVGPKLQQDIFPILLRFRLHKFVLTADISKTYRQFKVTPSDADFQRILWRNSPLDPIEEFRLTTVTYGTASAPFLATRALQQLAYDEGESFPLAKTAGLRDFYVDDVMTGENTLSKALELQTQLLELTSRGGLPLMKFSSNAPELLESIPQELRETQLHLYIDSGDSIKALGLYWHPGGDFFSFVVKLVPLLKANKRMILSDIARLYDPMGWLGPVIIKAKSFLQKLWLLKVDWDEPLPIQVEEDWIEFRAQLSDLHQLRIPRPVINDIGSRHQLHGFCDASSVAYAACVYLRSEDPDGTVQVSLLCSKTRVAPVKQVSIPRLELCGSLLLAELIKVTQESLHIQVDSIHAWTDSTITLDWISHHPSRWTTFVANRVCKIQELIPRENWAHVPGQQNPADPASRGIEPKALLDLNIWWEGPGWLSKSTENWPSKVPASTHEALLEEKPIKVLTIQAVSFDLFSRFSSLSKLVRVTAFMFRFVTNSRFSVNDRVRGPLTVKELDRALMSLISCAQKEQFAQVIGQLRSETGITSTAGPLASLNPFLDDKGLLRVGGRIHRSNVNYNQKHPVLLPKGHKLTSLIIVNEHLKNLHAGAQLLQTIIQQRFWILNGRSVIRSLILKCLRCFRERAKTQQQLMGDLPAQRLAPTRAFLCCGVDFGGPFNIKSMKGCGGKVSKAYIALFKCFSTKAAVHLELVTDLTSEAFIATLIRFVARRGLPTEIFSDNGTNFVGANRELKELLQLYKSEAHNKIIAEHLSAKGIQWHFIPARSPHFGGFWEAGIKSTKKHLRRVIGDLTLTYEELSTVLAQVEACLNSRPLTPTSTDPNDLAALTPGHFLIQAPLTAVPEPGLTDLRMNRLSRWQLCQQISQNFWKRWHREYLAEPA